MQRKHATFLGRYLAETGALVFGRLPAPGLAVRPRWRVLTADALAPVAVALAKMGYLAIVGAFGVLEKDAHERQGRGGENFLALPRWSIAGIAPGSSLTPERVRQIGARIDGLATFDPIAVVGAGTPLGGFMETNIGFADVSAEGECSHVRKLREQLFPLAQERWRYETAAALVSGVGMPFWGETAWEEMRPYPLMFGQEGWQEPWRYATQSEINAAARRYGTFVSVEGERL